MKHLHFIRSLTGVECWEYYESKTEAVVIADVDGMEYFIEKIKEACRSTKVVLLDEIGIRSNSMRVVLFPADKKITRQPALKIIERPFCRDRIKTMELVINGNKSGYQHLLDRVMTLMKKSSGEIDDNVRLDDWHDVVLVKRSVSLNIHAPVREWGKKSLGAWYGFVHERQATFVPPSIGYLFKKPEEQNDLDKATMEAFVRLK